jgi:hypothetical protein
VARVAGGLRGWNPRRPYAVGDVLPNPRQVDRSGSLTDHRHAALLAPGHQPANRRVNRQRSDRSQPLPLTQRWPMEKR